MSLFGGLEGQPDAWSLNGITFACAINDILDKDVFTLEELLEEDELLQEVKSRNTKLLDFLSQEEIVSQLVGYLTESPAEKDWDNDIRKFKYPYISCEVFCCEVPDILQTLVESEDNKLLKKLFSLLDSELPLNPHLGGYFEKILEMLFRRMTVPVIPFVNQGGITLLKRFLDQIDNYSVMQIVQRLMLPHIPFLMTIDPNDMMMDDRHNYQCNWSSIPEACDMLCDRMLDLQYVDVPSHVSDLLITVLQLSPPDASILFHLCNPDCLRKLFNAAFADEADHQLVDCPPSAVASVSLAALSVLESLVSRICEAIVPPGIDNSYLIDESNASAASGASGSDTAERDIIDRDLDIQILTQLRTSIANICAALSPHLPTVHQQLESYLSNSPCGRVATQTKCSLPRLGHRGLLMVKLIESIVRLGNSDIDKLLCDTGVLSSSVELIFTFKFNSLLHLTVQRIVLMVVEGGTLRRTVQHSLLFEYGFLRRLMSELRSNAEVVPQVSSDDIDIAVEIGKVEQKAKEREVERKLLAGSRCPLLGHLVQIAQAIGTAYFGEDIDRATDGRVIDDCEAHLVGDFDSGSCTPPAALSATQSVDTLSMALLKALSDFSTSQGEKSGVKSEGKEGIIEVKEERVEGKEGEELIDVSPVIKEEDIILASSSVSTEDATSAGEEVVNNDIIESIPVEGDEGAAEGAEGRTVDGDAELIILPSEGVEGGEGTEGGEEHSGDFVPSTKKSGPPSSSFRSLFQECGMASEWELFESEVLRDITDSQFAFQVTLERIEDNFGPMSLHSQMHGSGSSFEPFGSGREGAGDRSLWKHRNQMRIDGTDESNRQFSLEQDDEDDDDDDDDDEMDHHMTSHYMYSNHFNDSNGSSDFASFDDYSFPAQNGYSFNAQEPKMDDFADFGGATFETQEEGGGSTEAPRASAPITFDDFDFDTLNFQTDT